MTVTGNRLMLNNRKWAASNLVTISRKRAYYVQAGTNFGQSLKISS
jgi:hypothetical protein